MSDWKIVKLTDITSKITKGTTPSKKDGGFSESGINYIKAESVGYDGRIDSSKFSYVTEAIHNKLKRSQLDVDDILFSMAGAHLGKSGIVEEKHVPANTNQALALIRPKQDIVEPLYLLYFLQQKEVVYFVNNATSQSAQPNINLQQIGNLEIRLPEIEVQKSIVKMLSSLDRKIELNRQTNQTLEEMTQAIFKSWFVDFEPTRAKMTAKETGQDPELAAMATISGKPLTELDQLPPEKYQELKTTAALFPDSLVDSELGEIPEGWEVKALDKIAHYQNGLALQKFRPEDENDFLPVLKIAQLKKGFADGEEKASPNIKPECIVDNGDVVFSWSGSLVVDVWCGGKVALNQHLFKVTSSDYPKWFYCYWTKRHLGVFQQVAADKAVTMGHIKRSHLSEAECVVPNIELSNFRMIGDFIEKQIEQRLENTSLENIRNSLLPKLLSGEVSIS
ncbi:hypothetical protein OA92_08760 [Marinomonas sp. SBI22]|uniref:restriction endonuclease subunit S n=1 Tax=unclassified Marinomonas TaxID=196814 RepID=UPI0007AFDC42|nr:MULTISPECIES: restriction endonuclease subunit S [unclassified Marinomonas]KZM38787.1 hypothetical protein OA91_23545 [Marinomonas sp. SBI8L]KZM43750.1 hypothetical protein OA92_08760 [Marinomonas sp. SBI22]